MAEQMLVAIRDILKDDRFQVRKGLDLSHVSWLAEAYKADEDIPPITIARVGGVLKLIGGWHRVEALGRIGRQQAMAEIHDTDEVGALALASQENMKHGLKLKSGELRNLFRLYIKGKRHRGSNGKLKSSREIAKELGGHRTHGCILGWMKKDFPSVARLYGKADEFKGPGGVRELRTRNSTVGDIQDALNYARVAFKGITDKHARGDLIHEMEEMLDQIKASGAWEYVPPAF